MINVIIPLIKSNWQKEIIFSLRSWSRYFKENHKITIIGEHRPNSEIDFDFIYHKKNKNQTKEENLGDIIKNVLREFKEFIWTNDDIYLLKDITLEEIKTPYYHQDLSGIKNRNNNRWGKLLWNTADKLTKNKKKILNGETHTPYFYESDKIKKIIKEYEIDSGKGLLRTAYLNNFCPDSKKLENKIGFYNSEGSILDYDHANFNFLNHDDNGLTEELKNWISEFYK